MIMKSARAFIFIFMVAWDYWVPTRSEGLDGGIVCGVDRERQYREFETSEEAIRFKTGLSFDRAVQRAQVYEMVEQ